jgi:hypothetical protein
MRCVLVLVAEYLFIAFCDYDIKWLSHVGEWNVEARILLAVFAPLFGALGVCSLMEPTSSGSRRFLSL